MQLWKYHSTVLFCLLVILMMSSCIQPPPTLTPDQVEQLARKWGVEPTLAGIEKHIENTITVGAKAEEIEKLLSDLPYYTLDIYYDPVIEEEYPEAECYYVNFFEIFGHSEADFEYCLLYGFVIFVDPSPMTILRM